jgi:type IV pilus assembly protein PilC
MARLSPGDQLELCGLLAGAARGNAFPDELEAAAELASGPVASRLRRLAATVRGGGSLEHSIAEDRSLPPHLAGLVAAGVAANDLVAVLTGYIRSNLRQRLLRERMRESLIPPLFSTAAIAIVFIIIFVFIVPQFRDIFADFGIVLPPITMTLLGFAEFFARNRLGQVLAAMAAVLVLLPALAALTSGTWLGRTLLRELPIWGRVIRWQSEIRLYELLSLMVARNLPLPTALRLSAQALADPVMRRDALDAARRLEATGVMAWASTVPGVRHWTMGPLLLTARSGTDLGLALAGSANILEGRIQSRCELLRMALPPVLMTLTIAGVGVTALALLLPMLSLMTALSF